MALLDGCSLIYPRFSDLQNHQNLVSGGDSGSVPCHSVHQRSIAPIVLTSLTWWMWKESNLRTVSREDLQSPCFSLLHTHPNYKEREGFFFTRSAWSLCFGHYDHHTPCHLYPHRVCLGRRRRVRTFDITIISHEFCSAPLCYSLRKEECISKPLL